MTSKPWGWLLFQVQDWHQKRSLGPAHSFDCRLEMSGRATRSESKLPRRPPMVATKSEVANWCVQFQSDVPSSLQPVKFSSDRSSAGCFHCVAGASKGKGVVVSAGS